MVFNCANRFCAVPRQHDEGKLFRLDLDFGSKTGEGEHRTEYIWLCPDCALRMHPRVEVKGDRIMVRLSENGPVPLADTAAETMRARLN